MRIVSEWSYKHLKITVFHYNERFSLKAEDNLMEQTYKFRQGQIDNLDDIQSKIKPAFYDKVIDIFTSMKLNRDAIFIVDQEDEDEFDVII